MESDFCHSGSLKKLVGGDITKILFSTVNESLFTPNPKTRLCNIRVFIHFLQVGRTTLTNIALVLLTLLEAHTITGA